MAKLLMLKGLPGSGKSTLAKQLEIDNVSQCVRVNKDTIRLGLALPWSRELETKVCQVRDNIIVTALKHYDLVVCDDTNFAPKHERRLRQLAIEAHAEFEVRFIDTPLDECIKRDANRQTGDKVGKAVIMGMWEKYLKPATAVVYKADPNLPKAIICDLDGTLALFEGLRGPYDHAKCAADRLNKPIAKMLSVYAEDLAYTIILMSGREETFREQTLAFLNINGVTYDWLIMRPTRDNRKDAIVKAELFDTHVNGKYNVEFVLDDRDQVVKMWRDMGLTCLQVNYGAF